MPATIHRKFIFRLQLAACLVHSLAKADISLLYFRNESSLLLNIPANNWLAIKLFPVHPTSAFLLMQAHSLIWNITLSYDTPANRTLKQLRPSRHVTGLDIGLVQMLKKGTISVLYLLNSHNRSLDVFLQYVEYDSSKPVPGGCNLEFPLRIAPFMRISADDVETTLEFQKASLLPASNQSHTCDSLSKKLLYEVYSYYLTRNDYTQEEHFAGLKRMSTVAGMKKYGEKMHNYVTSPQTRLRFLSYLGKGVIYNLIVSHGSQQAAYTPISTYDCDLTRPRTCKKVTSLFQAYLLLVISLSGLFVCFRGIRFMELQLLLFTFVLLFMTFFILLGRLTHLHFADDALVSSLTAIALSCALLALWLRYRSSSLVLILNALALSQLLINLLLYTEVGEYYYLKLPINFWLVHLLAMLLVVVVFLPFQQVLHMLAASAVGSYLFLMSFEKINDGSLSYVTFNFFKRAIYDELYLAANQVPFLMQDYINSVIWVMLVAAGIIAQKWESKQPIVASQPVTFAARARLAAALSSSCSASSCSSAAETAAAAAATSAGGKQKQPKRNEYEEILQIDNHQEDLERYNQLTRSALKSSREHAFEDDRNICSRSANDDRFSSSTPIRSRLRSRLNTPCAESTPTTGRSARKRNGLTKSDELRIPIDLSFETSPSKSGKKRLPNTERASLLRSGIASPLDRSTAAGRNQSYSAI